MPQTCVNITFGNFANRVLLNKDQKITAKQALCLIAMKIKGQESESSQSQFTDQQNIEADHHYSSSSSEDHDFNKYLGKVENDQMKKRRLDVNDPFNVKLEKFKQHFHQPVEEKEVQPFVQTAIGRTHFTPLQIIRDAALTFTGLSLNQINGERLFSALKIIKSDLRASNAALFLET